MLKNTFCHIPGIKQKSERRIWEAGILSWEDAVNHPDRIPKVNRTFFHKGILDSMKYLEIGRADYFNKLLPSSELWRLYPDFKDSVAYLDIETNGSRYDQYITAISLYDGINLFTYVNGRNLDDFIDDVEQYDVLVTYNGKCFDIPFIEDYFRISLKHAHIDLRFLLHGIGLKGGLKGCEKKIGLHRNELDGMNGYFAVLLWNDYDLNGNDKALDTLLAYNVLDTVNLEQLLIYCFNVKIVDTPFSLSHRICPPELFVNPFTPDMETVARIMSDYGL